MGEATDSMREKIKTHDWADLALGEATDSLRVLVGRYRGKLDPRAVQGFNFILLLGWGGVKSGVYYCNSPNKILHDDYY